MQEILEFLNKIPDTVPDNPTFMEIGGYQYRENTFSNILRFYLNPNAVHGYGTQILDNFLEAANLLHLKDYEPKSVEVKREYTTDNGRIDLLIITNNWVLAIENKIYHHLNNNLSEYSKYISSNFSQQSTQIVLSIRKEENTQGFYNLLYSDLVKVFEKLEPMPGSEYAYQIYFIHFNNQLKKLTMQNPMSVIELKFFLENSSSIQKVNDLQAKFQGYTNYRVNRLIELIGKIDGVTFANYLGGDLVVVFSNNISFFKLECPIAYGNKLYLTIATENNKATRETLSSLNYFKQNWVTNSSSTPDRYVLEDEIEFLIEDEVLAAKIKNWITLIRA